MVAPQLPVQWHTISQKENIEQVSNLGINDERTITLWICLCLQNLGRIVLYSGHWMTSYTYRMQFQTDAIAVLLVYWAG
jgi:hypothetical protein